MTRSDPLPSTGKRHPIFARVIARAGPAMDAQGALEHRGASSPAWLAGSWRRVPAAASTSPTTRQRLPSCSPSSLSRTFAPWPKPPPSRLPSPSAWSTAAPMPCPVPMPAWTPPSHRWCCARCPTSPRPGRTAPGATPRWRASLLRAHPSRHLRPGQGPAPRRRHVAHLCWRLPHQPRHADRHHQCRLPSHQHPPVPVSRQPAAVASRAARARDRPPPTRIPTRGAPSDRLAHRRVILKPELRPDSAR
jgi:hypothetical protein